MWNGFFPSCAAFLTCVFNLVEDHVVHEPALQRLIKIQNKYRINVQERHN